MYNYELLSLINKKINFCLKLTFGHFTISNIFNINLKSISVFNIHDFNLSLALKNFMYRQAEITNTDLPVCVEEVKRMCFTGECLRGV